MDQKSFKSIFPCNHLYYGDVPLGISSSLFQVIFNLFPSFHGKKRNSPHLVIQLDSSQKCGAHEDVPRIESLCVTTSAKQPCLQRHRCLACSKASDSGALVSASPQTHLLELHVGPTAAEVMLDTSSCIPSGI